MTGPVADTARVCAVALLLTVGIAAPVLLAPSERIFGIETVGRHHDPFTVMEHLAGPLSFGPYMQPLTDIPGAGLTRLMGPVRAYNWLVLVTFPLAAGAAYLLGRHLQLSRLAALLAALAFAFSPFHLAQSAYHPHVAQIQWMPLFLLAMWRCLDDARPSRVAALLLATTAVMLSNFYGALIAALIAPVAGGGYWFFKSRREPGSSRALALTAGSLGVLAAAGMAYAWLAAPAVVANTAAFGYPREDLVRYAARWWSYLAPPIANPIVGRNMERAWVATGMREGLLEQQVSLGLGVVALAAVAVGVWWIRDRRLKAFSVVPVLALVAVFAAACSLAPDHTIAGFIVPAPSGLLHGLLPMFRAYARFAVVVQLMAVLLAAIGAERLWCTRKPLLRGVCAGLLVLAAAEYVVSPAAMSRDVLPTAAHRWMVNQPGEVRALDCAGLTAESQSVQWLTADRIRLRTPEFDDCTQPNIAGKLRAVGYTHLIVRRQTPEGRWLSGRAMPDGLEPVARFRDAQVFTVTAPVPDVYTAGMRAFHPREHDQAWGWRWMGAQASWTVVNASGRSVTATLGIELTAFAGPRQLRLLLDGREVHALLVAEGRNTYPLLLTLTSGEHELTFQPVDPPTDAAVLTGMADTRLLSFGIGDWSWRVEAVRR